MLLEGILCKLVSKDNIMLLYYKRPGVLAVHIPLPRAHPFFISSLLLVSHALLLSSLLAST